MICNFPSPTGLCSLGQPRIVVPSLVMEFIGTIRQSAPHKRGDRVDHHPEFVFGALHFAESGIASGASSIFGTGRELCFVMDCQALMVLQSEFEILPRVDAGFNLLEESAKPNQRNMTYVLSVKR